MIFNDKQITLKDGRTAVLCSPRPEDAEKLLSYIKRSCGETEFLVRYPEEIKFTVEQEAEWANERRTSPNIMAITCYVGSEIAGNCEIVFKKGLKTAHKATVEIALLEKFWNLGIGTAMFTELVAAAQGRGVEILELDFVEDNDRARHLYEKFSFRVVSENPHALKLKDGTYRSTFHMQSYLKEI